MSLLALIKYKECAENRWFRLIEKIQNECRNLGSVLGIDEATLKKLDKTGDGKTKCTHILQEWIQRGKSNYGVTWAGLLEALKDALLGGVAEQLEKALRYNADTDSLKLQNCKLLACQCALNRLWNEVC